MVRAAQAALSIMLATSCRHAVWQATPLAPEEVALLGCYELMVGPWADPASSLTRLRVQLDTLGSPTARRLVVLSTRGSQQPFAYWASVSPDSLALRVGRGVEGQGLELRVRARDDSVEGIGINHIWVNEFRTAPAQGARFGCPKASSDRPQPNKRLKLAARVGY
jgi:hypothetical protein